MEKGILMLAPLLATIAAFAAEAPKDLSLDEVKTIVGCRPMVISGQGPQIESFGQSQIVTEVGAERFIRTDMGKPDGKLTMLRQGKKLCELEISLLPGFNRVWESAVIALHLRQRAPLGHLRLFKWLHSAGPSGLEKCAEV